MYELSPENLENIRNSQSGQQKTDHPPRDPDDPGPKRPSFGSSTKTSSTMPRRWQTADSSSVSSPSEIIRHDGDIDSYIAALEARNTRLRRKLEGAKERSRSSTFRFLPLWARGPLLVLVGTYALLRLLGPDSSACRAARDEEHSSSILTGESKLAGDTAVHHDFWLGVDRDQLGFHGALSHSGESTYPFTLYPFGNLTLTNLGFVFADPWSTLGIPANNVLHPLHRGEGSITEWDEALEEAERRAEEFAKPWEDEEACDPSRGWYLPEVCLLASKRFRSAVNCLTHEKCRRAFARRFEEGGLGTTHVVSS